MNFIRLLSFYHALRKAAAEDERYTSSKHLLHGTTWMRVVKPYLEHARGKHRLAEELFVSFDESSHGIIEFKEVILGLANQASPGLSIADRMEILFVVRGSSSTMIAASLLATMMHRNHDWEGNGASSGIGNGMRIMDLVKNVETFIESLDMDGDGCITWKFSTAVNRQPSILHAFQKCLPRPDFVTRPEFQSNILSLVKRIRCTWHILHTIWDCLLLERAEDRNEETRRDSNTSASDMLLSAPVYCDEKSIWRAIRTP